MFMLRSFGFIVTALMIIIPLSSQAGVIEYFTDARFTGGNRVGANSFASTDLVEKSFSGAQTASQVSANLTGQKSFQGLDSSVNLSIMTVNYNAESLVDAGVIKAKASGSVQNPIYNENNAPFVTNANFDTNENGIPSLMGIESRAIYKDDFLVTGGTGLNYVTFDLMFDGSLFAQNAHTYVQVDQLLPEWSNLFFESSMSSSVDVAFTSMAVPVVNGVANFGLSLRAGVDFDLEFASAALLQATSDFYSTLTIESVRGFDNAGMQVQLTSVNSSDGTQFRAQSLTHANVPEPSSFLLLFSSIFILSASRTKRFMGEK